jgi:hypothetical protein
MIRICGEETEIVIDDGFIDYLVLDDIVLSPLY